MRVCDLKIGQKARIERIRAVNGEMQKEVSRLLDLGFVRGTEISYIGAAPLGDPIEVSLRGYSIALRRSCSSMIEVELI